MKINSITLAIALNAVLSPVFASESDLTLNHAIALAVSRDVGLQQLNSQALTLKETGISSSSLLDPKVKLGIGGLPVDSYRFDQDAMTNMSIGVAQQFSRGDTLALSLKSYNQQAEVVYYQSDLRKLEIAKRMTQLWIELHYLIEVNQLVSEIQILMKEMTSFIADNYALGKNETQDLLYAELQLSQLEEQLQKNQQMQQRVRLQFSEWITPDLIDRLDTETSLDTLWHLLPQQTNEFAYQPTDFYSQFLAHPQVQAVEQTILIKQTQVEIAQQAYAPQFGVEVGYAYRQANGMNGQPASDLVSVYLTMDIPIFTDKKQDRTYSAALHQVDAAQSQKDLLLIQMNSKVNALISDQRNLQERITRYQTVLVKQAKERTQAIERGYENNTSPFNELIVAAQDELMIAKEKARLIADLNHTQNELAYSLNLYDLNFTAFDASGDSLENK